MSILSKHIIVVDLEKNFRLQERFIQKKEETWKWLTSYLLLLLKVLIKTGKKPRIIENLFLQIAL